MHWLSLYNYGAIDSTQAYAREYYANLVPTKSAWGAVRATAQTAGMGTNGRQWQSPAGNLYITFLVPELESFSNANCLHNIPQVAAWSVLECLADLGVTELQWKWPNDVYCRGKKIAGVLAESYGDHILVGIGVNVNTKVTNAISVAELIARPIDLGELSYNLADSLRLNLNKLLQDTFSSFIEAMNHCLFAQGKLARNHESAGVVVGIDANGYLVLDNEGSKQIIRSGTMIFQC